MNFLKWLERKNDVYTSPQSRDSRFIYTSPGVSILRFATPRRVGAKNSPQRSVSQLSREGREDAVLVHITTVLDVRGIGGEHDFLGAGSQEVYALMGGDVGKEKEREKKKESY